MLPIRPRLLSRPALRLLGLAALAVSLRLLFLHDFIKRSLFQANFVAGTDMQFLLHWARTIAEGDALSRTVGVFWWAPFYPYTLATVLKMVGTGNVWPAALAQDLLSAATAAALYVLGRRLLDETTALLAGLLAALYSPLIFYTGVFLSTTLEFFLAVLFLIVLTLARIRPRPFPWFTSGIVGALSCLARPNFLLGMFVILLLIPVLLPRHDGRLDWKLSRTAWAAFVLGLVLVILPVTTRNLVIGGRLVLISAAGPETFRIGNSYDSTPVNFIYPRQPMMPLTSTAFWRHQARKAVLFWSALEVPQNISYYLAREESWVLGLPLLNFWLAVPLAAVGLWATRRNARELLHVYAFLAAYYVSVVVFFVIARWRLPLITPLLLFSAAGLLAVWRNVREHYWTRTGVQLFCAAGIGVAIFPWNATYIFPADHGELGYILANQGRYAEAVPRLALAAAGFPSNGVLQRDLGTILVRLGRLEDARPHLERAAVSLPDDPRTHRDLGRVLAETCGDAARAGLHLQRYLALSPGAADREAIEAVLLRLKRVAAP